EIRDDGSDRPSRSAGDRAARDRCRDDRAQTPAVGGAAGCVYGNGTRPGGRPPTPPPPPPGRGEGAAGVATGEGTSNRRLSDRRVIFGAFERMVALRYLRARRQEGFVSVIAIFSLLGIALGVATLIIVMAVMNGFRTDLIARILGLNGDLGVYAASGGLSDFDTAAQKVRQGAGVVGATPPLARHG